MAVDISTEIVINRPIATVAAFAIGPDNAPLWYVNIKSVEWKTPRPLAVGSQIAFLAHFLGRTLAYTYEITEVIPNQRLVMRTAQGPFPMQTEYTFTPISANATRMQLRNVGAPTGFSRLVAPLIATAMRHANKKDLERLKQVLEQRS